MRLVACRWWTVLLALAAWTFFRKSRVHVRSLHYLNEAADFGADDFDKSQAVAEALNHTKSPAIVLLNKYALNVTLNFICNLRQFNASGRIVAFAFDYHSHSVISESFPEVKSVWWKLPALEDGFVAGDGRYQLFQYFRATLSAYLTTKVHDFWMVQADTIWKEDLFKIADTAVSDLTFDQEGDEGLLASMVAGGYYHVKSSQRTQAFFENMASTLLNYYVTDNNLMTRQCLLNMFNCTCSFFPYSMLANWRYQPRPGQAAPVLFQLDGGENAEQKFQKMARMGALFVEPDSLAAHPTRARCASGAAEAQTEARSRSKANWLIRSGHFLAELLCLVLPGLRTAVLGLLFPFYAYFLAI